MNPGAFLFEANVLTPNEIAATTNLVRDLSTQKKSVHQSGKYADLKWFQVPVDKDLPVHRKVVDRLGDVGDPELFVFYYLEPTAKIHPHRDLTGAGLNNRIRFHVPIVTNEGVDFRVDGEKVVMKPGDLWCLDTSYIHSVENAGAETRVHMVIECAITPAIKAKLPRGWKVTMHNAAFVSILAARLVQSVAWKSFREPAYFRDQMRMVGRFLRWRVLKQERAS